MSNIICVNMRVTSVNDMLTCEIELNEINPNIIGVTCPLKRECRRSEHQQKTQTTSDHHLRLQNCRPICLKSKPSAPRNNYPQLFL